MLSILMLFHEFLFMQAISFSDFFLADILTSMSKVYALSLHDDGPTPFSQESGNENALL